VLAESGEAALPVQALSEFANVALRKLELPAGVVYEQLHHLMIAFPVLPLTGAVVREAVRGVKDYRFNFYDAQIWAVAKLSGASVVLSEDFPEGAAIEGVKFLNPLVGTFVP
jgi:predicted nucleic acid-binding protein